VNLSVAFPDPHLYVPESPCVLSVDAFEDEEVQVFDVFECDCLLLAELLDEIDGFFVVDGLEMLIQTLTADDQAPR
jgi:hypothetical protein